MKRLTNTLLKFVFVLFAGISTTDLKAGDENLLGGSYIIDMGVSPQTVANGLKPYGLIWDLIVNHQVPVKWIIDPSKVKDGLDFTYNANDYKGGPFIIPSEYIDSTIQSVIAAWELKGVVGLYTTSSILVPVYATIRAFPNLVIDLQSANLITPYFTNAEISSSVYYIGLPSDLDLCDDIYAMPHADPAWSTHSYLYDYVVNEGGWFWSSCHAVSVMENLSDPNPPYHQLNFLSTGLQCYDTAKCGSITEWHAKNVSDPISYSTAYNSDPVMQFIGNMDDATRNGSEQWYIPLSTAVWRSTTKRTVRTASGSAPSEGVLMSIGPAFGDSSNGMVMYEAGHEHTDGVVSHQVAAQRAFFNFLLYSVINKGILLTGQGPQSINSGNDSTFIVTPVNGTAPYTYNWTSSIAGSFSAPNDSITTFHPDSVSNNSSTQISVVVTDACGRSTFKSWVVAIYPPNGMLPVQLSAFNARVSEENIVLKWTTASEINNAWFVVQRKLTGQNDFVDIAKVMGKGSTNIQNTYSFLDIKPQSYPGSIYYRLKQVDYNGQYDYSWITGVDYKPKNISELSIFPNPSSNTVHINFVLKYAATVSLLIFDVKGKLVYAVLDKISLPAGTFQGVVPLIGLPDAIYYIRLSFGSEWHTTKFVKLNN